MQKFLRTLTLMALMLVPWVTQGQQTLPYSYGFEDGDLTTDGWLLLNATSSGISSNAAQNGSYGFLFYYGEDNDATLISPVLNGTTNGVTVSFSYKEYSSDYGDEQFYVGYTTDETVTDPDDFTYGSIITASLSWQQYENTFPAGTKRIAIKYVYNDAYYLFLDDFTFEAPSSCAKPATLNVTGVTASSISVAWTAGGSETSWNVYLNGVQQNTTPVTTTSYTFNGLSLGDYTIGVTAICGSDESAPKTIIHHLGYCVPSPSSVDGNGITNVTFGLSPSVNDNLSMTSSPYYYDHSNLAGGSYPGGTVAMSIAYATNYAYYTWVWVDWNNDFTFSESEKVYAATSTISSGTLELSFDVPSTTALGDYRMRIMGKDGTTNDPCYSGSYAYLVDYTLRVGEAPSCMPVSDLAYSNLTDAGVTLSWTDPNGGSNTYVVKIGDDVLSATTTPAVTFSGTTATITGLTALTSYTFSVAVYCGSATSPSSNISVTTPCGAETMPWTENFDSWTSKSTCWSFLSGAYNMGNGTPTTYSSAWTLSTSYGSYITLSGKALAMNIYSTNRYWAVTPNINITTNDAVLNVDVAVSAWSAATTNYDANDTLAFAISTDGGATFTHLMALNNTELNALANTYTTISVPVSGYNGQTVRFAIFGGSSASGGDNRIVIDNVIVDVAPTCYKPTALTYDNVTTNGATLTWTRDTRNADGETYSILDENNQVVTGAGNISGTSYQLTGLTQNTEYTFKVRTNCANPSENVDDLTVTFTTLADCQAPVLAANGITNITAHTADVAWTGFASNNSYVVSYRTAEYVDGLSVDFENGSMPAGWTTEGNGTWSVGTGDYSTATGAHSGTKNALIKHSTTGNTTYLVTPNMDLSGRSGWVLNMWYINRSWGGDIDEFGVYYRINGGAWNEIFATTSAHASWTELNVNLPSGAYAANCQIGFKMTDSYGYGVAIDDILMGETIPAGAWQTVPANTPSTTLTGLEDETPYEVKVTGICAGNVESDESAVQTFTTLPSCMAITGLTVSDVTTNSVMLTWTDNANTGATYTIYNVTDNNSIVASGVNATTYTVTGLTENTAYTFGVLPICQEGETTPVTVSTRTECAPKSLPWTCGFEADEIQSTTQATALPWCSYRKVESVTYPNYPYSYSSSTYAHNSTRSLYFYGTTSATYPLQMAWIMPEVDVNSFPMNGNRVTFYARSSSASYDKVVHVGTMTDPTDWSTYTEVGTVTVTGTTHTLYKRSLSAATATDAYVVLMVERGSGSLYIDDVTLEELPACVEITNLAVADATDNTLTLTWTDADNEDVTYTIYNMDDNSTVATGVNTTTYTVTGLTANTPYIFGVQANCLTGDASMSTVNARTACPAITPLPYAEDFSEYTSFQSSPYTGPSTTPYCWLYYSNGTNTATTTGSAYYGGVARYTSTTYGSLVANNPYLYLPIQLTGANVTNSTYINYGTQRGSVKIAAMPLFDLPLDNIQVSFDYKMSSAYSATGAAAVLELGYITNDDFTTFEPMQSWNAVTTTQSVQLNLNELAASAPANARLAFKFSGVHNGTGTSSYTNVACGIDNISVEEIPTVLGVTASNVTANSVDLNWDVFRTCAGVSYTVTYGSESTQVSTTNTTISGLTPNTEYTFDVSSSCAAANEPHATVTVNTLQIPATLPYATGFETTDDNAMWTILNGTNGWFFGTAANNGGEQGLYISNNNGSDNAYTNSGTGTQWSYAYRMLDISEAGWYNFSFDWKANGESNFDYLRAWLAPASVSLNVGTSPTGTTSASGYTSTNPTGWIDLYGGKMNLQTSWQSVEKVTEITEAGTYTLVLMWVNDNSSGTTPPAAVDNVKVTRNAFEPVDLTATNITATGATLTWTRDTRNAGNETYTIMNGTETVATGIDANNYNVTLTPNTDYTFSVYATNSLDNSDAENVSIRVNEYPTEAGKMVNLTYSYDFTTTGETPNVDFYYGMGTNRTATAAQSLTAATADGAVFTNTTSLNWSVDGPVTVVFLNHNATALNFSDVAVTYLCPAVITDRDAVVETINTGSFTWTTPENHEYNYGPVHGTTLNEKVAALVGTYNDTVLNAGLCDSVYNHLNLTIYPTYEVTLTDEFCEGITYTVGTGDEAHNYTASIQEDVHLTAIGGADSLVHVNLQMNAAPVALINNNVSNIINGYCEGFDLTLNASAVEGASVVNGAIFEWEDATTAATRVVNPLSTTNNVYTLNATDPVTGCVSLQPATLTVTTTPVPVLTVTADRNAICLGQNSAVLSVTDANNIEGVTFRWYNANTNPATVAGTGATLTVNPTETTVYYVVAEGNCNVQSDNITITVNALPVVEATAAPTVICQNGTITLTATNVDGYNYSWNTNATTATATVAAATTGNFTVTVTDQNGCVNEFTTNNVTVNPVYELNDAQSVCYIQNPYTWKAGAQTAMSITADGNYDYTFQTVNGCDSLVHLTFTFEQMSINNTYREVCQNTDVTWGPATYTSVQESATYTYELGVGDIDPDNNILECPAQYNLILTVNPVKATSFEQVACDTYTWNLNGETYTADATPSVTLATTKGCDSTVTMNLTVNYQNTGTDVQVACDSYEWPLNHNIYTESNNTAQYTLIGANAAGCDSVVTLNLTVNYKKDSTVFYRECDHTTFVWTEGNGQTYNLNVAAEDNITWNLTAADPTVTTVDGCDSILHLSLVMNYVSDTLNWVNIEECDSWYVDTVACDGSIGRKYIDESGDYLLRTRNAATGRDRISRVHLTINRSEHQTVVESQCVPWIWNADANISHEITSDTILSQELETTSGCQLIKVLRFTAKYPSDNTTLVTRCQNQSWTDGNSVVYDMTNYELGENAPVQWNMTTNEVGCDSIDYVVFTVNPVYNVNGTLTYCEGEFTNGALTYTNPNNATETIELTIPAGGLNEQVYNNTVVANWTTAAGCDSIVTIAYTVNPSVTEDVTVQNCYTYTWNGREYNTLGLTEDTFETVSALTGCDSTAILHLTLTDTVIGIVTIEACGEYTYNNVTYRESKTFVEESGVANSGCDSVTHFVYHLTPRVMKDVYVVANAPYTWDNGETYTAAVDGIYYDATEPGGCDSILVLHLTMEQPIVICEGELPYTTTFGITLTDDTDNYTETVNGVLYDIDYTVNHNTVETVTVDNACNSYNWHGQTYTVSGTYTFDTANANGCDSTVTLALTVNVSTDSVLTYEVCDTYTWSGITFTKSADTTLVGLTNFAGCDSTATLHLTINVNPGVEETVAICNSYVWNNQTLTVTGDYNQSFNDANGCTADSVLHLTINTPTDNNLVIIDTAASTYYNGTYYADINEANGGLPYTFDVLYEGANVNGCDSTDHVTLYVTRGVVTDENFNICGNFTWTRNNHTYVWIDAAERQANGNALYKDITDATAPVYIHTGENPIAVVADAMGVPTQTYVLWLNMIEANYFDYDLGDIMLSDQTSITVNPGDSLDAQTIDLSTYIAAKENATLNVTLHHTSTYYCENVVTYTANLIYNFVTDDPVTVCDVTSWTDPVDGVHTVTIGAANDIDYITTDNWHHHVVVNVTARTISTPQVATACDTYTWTAGDGQTYTISGNYPWNDDVNCTTETLQLTINTNAGSTETATECDTYTWNAPDGQNYTYTEGGVKTVQFTDANGCEGTATLNLTINTNAGTTETETACDSYTWQYMAAPLTESDVYTVNYTDANGCEGVHTLNLTINAHQDAEFSDAACVSYTWAANNDAVYTTSGDYTRPIVDANNCPATETLHLTINTPVPFTREQFVYGNGITINGHFYEAAATGVADYTVVLDTIDDNGCATTVTISLHVSQYEYVYTNHVGCGSYTWTTADNGNNHTYRTLTTDEATANPTALYFDETANAAVLEMPQYSDGNMIYRLNLTLNEPSVTVIPVSVPLSQLAASGYVYTTVDGTIDCSEAATATANTTVTADFSMGPHAACDSIVRYNVNVIYNYFTDAPVTLCAQTTYEVVAGDVRTIVIGENTLVYTLNAGAANEEVHTVVVTNNDYAPATPQTAVACDTYTWTAGNGQTYTSSTTVNWNNDATCTAETLQLTINTNAGSTESATECDTYTWNAPDGEAYTYTEGGVKTVQFTDANGCEGTATLNLTINTNAGTTETETACDSYTWQYMAAPLTESDVYTVNYTDANGCEGVHTLNLTINAHQDAEFSDAACVSYTWAANNDAVYTTSGDYTRPIVDANNCAATETLHLTISQPESEDVEFWFGEGSYRYTGIFTTATSHMYTPGDYTGISETVTGVTANGCDSIYNITLHVGNNYSHTEAVRSCNTYTWDRNDVTYVRLTNEQRAANPTALYFDQTNNELVYYNPVVVEPRVNDYADEYMLDLTLDAITERDTVIYFPVSLGVLNYAGQTYDYTMTNDEGRVFVDTTYEYEIHLGAVQACDSIINLTVHVLNNYILDETVDVCYTETSYTWQGQTLTLDANPDATNTYYMYDLNTNDNTVHYITLIQHPIQYTTERRTECDSYIWNGRTFTESTSGATLTLTDQFGCDSTVTLVLTINHNTSTVLGSENAPIVTCDSYTWTLGDNTELPDKIEESGVYTWDYTTAEGCESHDTLYLTVNASTHTVDEITACDTYTWDAPDNNSYDMTADAVMLVNYNNEYGCASTATLNLTINHSSSSSINKAECDTYTWEDGNNQTYTESGVYTYVTTNAANCDSTVTLTLTIDHSNGTTTATACDSYTWTEGDGHTYTESDTYEYTSDVANSCGSLTQTLVLTIHKNAGHSDTVAICNSNLPAGGYEWHGNYYTASTVDYANYFDANNCPSVDTLNLVIGNVRTYGREYVENCGPFTWELTGETFTESTEASTIMAGANAVGCDSVLYLYLTVKHAPVVELGETVICESALPYIWEGEEYTESGDYNKSFALDNGCDSVINMTLTVSSVKDTNLTDQICLGNGYTANDFNIAAADIATAGEYTFTRTLTSSLNCDSVVTLTLTVGDILTNTVEATACDSYAWNAGDGQTYNFTESGTYNSGSYANAMGCTTVDELTLTINQNSSTGYTETVCDAYMWNGTQYTESGDYTYGYTDNNNCESVDTLHLTVNNSVVNNIPVTACDSYTWENGDGQTYTVSGVYTYSYTTTAGCNGTDYLVLTINTNSNAEYNETVCDTYTWHNTEYTESGDYEYDYEATNGCPSTDVLHLTVNESTTSEETAENCSFYNWHGETYTTTGDYTYVTTNDAGCQHIATLHLTINNPVVVTIDTTVCGYLTWNGISYNESDVITHNFTAANGCDSTEIINLTVNNTALSAVSTTACDSYTWDVNGTTYDHSGNYVAVLAEAAANGCDSMITLVLTVNHSSNSSETATACDSYTWNGQTYTTSGVQTYEYNSVEGCPSVDTLYLTINNSAATNENVAICNSYTWNGVTYTNSGVYTNTYQTVNGCDSTVTLTLTINPAITNNITESVCGSYTWDNTTYTTSGIYTNTYTAVSGCDSIVNLYLTILAPISITNSVTACDSYTWNNTNYTTSGNYTHTYTAANGCDSVVTLALTINASASTTLTATACDSYVWNGATYTASGSYVQNGLTVNGCDSTVTLNLTINPIVTNTISESVCGSYTWNGTNYTTSGIYTHTYTAVTGCDSIVNLMLTITPPVTVTNHVTACDSYTWNGQTYTTSGNYSTTYTGANGCDSIVTLNLTINNSTSTTVNETACGGYIWNGQTYTTSGVYLYNYTGVNGCDSTVTLNLTIAQSVATSEAVSACESYIWNGTTYTTSGNYTHTYTAVNGCDSVVTLQLTVNMPTTGVDNQTACDSYTWINGQTYTASTNTPVFTITNVAGCDSVVTLNLTLGYTVYAIDEQEACDSYIWIDNQNYTESVDDATYTLHTAEGCDSIVTLHLTINYSVEVYDTIDVLQSQLPYTYNGVDITAAGNYEFNGTTVNGCDSTIYLRVNVTGDMPTAVDVVNILNDVNIYPNPTHGRVTVTADNVVKIEVLDIVGRLVATFDNTNTFDISNLNEGAYTLRITLPEGVTVRKVVRK